MKATPRKLRARSSPYRGCEEPAHLPGGHFSRLDRFYEADLHELATGGDAERFIYFYAFFHRSAFDEHPLSVRAMLEESVDYARSVGDSLKSQVYEGQAEAATLERRLSDLVNRAYELTPEEVDLLWSTAPPRMPRF